MTNVITTPSSPIITEVPASARHRGLLCLFIVLLVWLPIPIGSNRPWSIAIFEATILFLLGAWSLGFAFSPFALPVAVRSMRTALLVLSAWALYPVIQLVPIPAAFAEALSEHVHGLYAHLPRQSVDQPNFLSVDRGATLAGLLRQAGLVAAFFCTLAFVTTAHRLKLVLLTFFVVGFAEALYGLILLFGGDQIVLWNPGHDQHTVSGTYVNQNHFAGLMEITIAIGMGLLVAVGPTDGHPSSVKGYLRVASSYFLGTRGLVLFMLLIMIGALLMSTSRGAVGSLAIGLSAAVILAAARKGIGARETKIGVTAAVLVALALVWLGPGEFAGKLQSEGLRSDRGDLRETSYRMVSDSPLVGTGVGTYRWVFPAYKDARFGSGFYEHAHNDYLEVLGEQGFIGFGLLAAGMALVLVPIVQAYGVRRDPLMRATLFGAIAGTVSLMVHGLVDFNFQIPANAAYFCVLLALGVVATRLKSNRHA